MLYRVERGANYGWSVMEGCQPVLGERERGPTPIVPPTAEHSHTESRSITGGYVYTGQRLPELHGAYIYGDYVTGKVWGLRHDGHNVTWQRELVDTPLAIVCFGIDRKGELFIADYATGTLHRLVPRPPADVNQKFPTRLSETGLFADTARHLAAPGVLSYSINAEAWADGTTAERFVALPGLSRLTVYEKENVQIGHVKGMWRFPPDGVLAKTVFFRDGATRQRRRIETQILHYNGDDWCAYTYLWNDRQTDAELVAAEGADLQLTLPDPAAPSGSRRQSYRVASRTECLLCHTTRGGSIYGFTPAQLNRAHSEQAASNQLRWLVDIGLFELPVDVKTPPLADPYDDAASLNQRARAYLHINCSHCHLRGGGGSSYFDVRAPLPLERTRLLDQRPNHGTFGIAGAQVVHRGDPTRSVLYYRMAKLGRGHMPHLGSNTIDERGLKLIGDWIASLAEGSDGHSTSPHGDAIADEPIESRLASTSNALGLIRAIDARQLKPTVIRDAVAKGAAHGDPQVRDLFERFVPEEHRIQRLGSAVRPDELLALSGNAERGKHLFFDAPGVTCRNCHRLGSTGAQVGPELDAIGRKLTRPQLLESILEPSKAVDPKYVAWLAETSQGQVHVGLLVERSDAAVVLRDAQNRLQRIAASDIEVLAPQRQSLMPELLLRDMTRQEVADLLAFLAEQRAEPGAKPQANLVVTWAIDDLNTIGGHKVAVYGQPRVIDTPQGRAVEFDGVDDGLIVENHPLAGAKEFTAEVVFRPALGGPREQRFFHLQETGSENRVLFETRIDGPDWFLDTYIKSGAADATLYAEGFKHPIGPWYQAAIVVDGRTMKHYVNGKLELEKPLAFAPHAAGQTSIGMRHNRVHWYQGAVRQARFTPRVLQPEEFLKP
jgi:putative heme-binding domain-containing protein